MPEPDIYWNPSISRVAMYLNKEDAELLLGTLTQSLVPISLDDGKRLLVIEDQLKRAVANSK